MRNEFKFLLLFLGFALLFFYPIFKGYVPFPGDLLISENNPYSSYSFLGYSPGSFPNKAQNVDVLEQLFPWKYFSIESFKNFEIPLWNPYNFSGTPHLASIQSGTFYPLNLIFFIMPFILAWTIYILIQPVLSGFFTFLFLRELKLGQRSSLIGGLAFSFSSFLVVWMEYGNIGHAIVWLPIILWLSLKNLKNPTVLKSIAISFALAFSIFAGHLQVSMYLYAFVFIFVLYNTFLFYKKEIFSKLLLFLGIYVLAIILAAIQLFPSIELFLNSSRSEYSAERIINFLIPVQHLITAIFPDFFGNPVTRNYWITGTYIERVSYFGVIPLAFALFAVIGKKSPHVWFFLGTLIATFFLAFDSFITKFLYSLYLPPVLNSSIPTRIMFLFAFAGSVLAAFGYERFEKAENKKRILKSVFILGGIVLFSWALVILGPNLITASWVSNLNITLRNLVVPTAAFMLFLAALLLRDKLEWVKKYFFILILILTIFELYFFFHKFTPFAPKESVYPKVGAFDFIKDNQGIHRSWSYGSARISSNIQTYENIYWVEGYDPFYIKRYGELLSSSKDGKISESVSRSNADLAPGFGDKDIRENKYRQKLMNLLGVKYILHKNQIAPEVFDQTFDNTIHNLVWHENGLQIYENKAVLPRAFLVNDYAVIKDREKIIDTIYSDEFDPREAIILEEEPREKPEGELGEYSIDVKNYSGNEAIFNISSESDGFLFLSDSYFPGWKAYVNGEETKIYRTNYSFRSIYLPKGKSLVVFEYDPLSFKMGWITSLSGIALVLILAVLYFLKKRYVK